MSIHAASATRAVSAAFVVRPRLARPWHWDAPMLRSVVSGLTLAALASAPSLARAAPRAKAKTMTLTPVDREPPRGRRAPSNEEVAGMLAAVHAHPEDRAKRLALVRGLVARRELDDALAQAKAWRAKDAYNLVAVRALGDVYMERGDKRAAERVYSAVVELLPGDPDAQRALASVLEQRGDLAPARERLAAAVEARPDDPRLRFELADVELRLGHEDAALAGLKKVIAPTTDRQIRYPAKQRLGQLYGEMRRRAKSAGDQAKSQELTKELDALGLKGGLENDLHVYLTWDTDRTDVDLWVITPSGEKIFYQHRTGANGESLFDDVTRGYGPESFTVKDAAPGEYAIAVNYYSARRGAFPEAHGEVVVVLDEGRATERKTVLPYRLFAEKQTVTVAKVRVSGASEAGR